MKSHTRNLLPLSAGLLLLFFVPASQAATTTAGVDITVSVPSSSNLTLGSTSLNFVAEDPELMPVVPAQENPVAVTARVRTVGTPSLTVIASDDLKDAGNVIPISALTWTADGTPFVGGTMDRISGQPAATFPAGSGAYNSSFRFSLANDPSYAPGNYATTLTYTLTAP